LADWDFGANMNDGMDNELAGVVGMRQQQWLNQNGLEGSAEVLAMTATGRLHNQDPVVNLTVKIQPAMIAVAFETTGKIILSRAASLRVGDLIKVKYNPANPTQFIVLTKNG
jgi:hypothetical protein